MQGRTIDTEAAAILFNRSRGTIRRWLRGGKLVGEKHEGQWKIPRKGLGATWSAVMGGRKASSAPVEDFQRFRALVEKIERRDIAVFEDAQHEVFDLALALLATEDGFRAPVWKIIQRVKHAAGFGFFETLPDFVPIH